jgi:Tfp pilus assembly protein PilO
MKIAQIDNLKLDNKKILLITLAVLFIIYADYAFVVKMQMGNLRILNPKVAKLKKDINSFNKDSSEISRLKNQPQQPASVGKRLISENELPGLLEYISDAGNKNSIRIMQTKPSWEAKAKDAKPLISAAKFSTLYISLDIFATYHNIGAFINALESADRFISVQDLKIFRDKNDYMRQEANLTLKTYVKK